MLEYQINAPRKLRSDKGADTKTHASQSHAALTPSATEPVAQKDMAFEAATLPSPSCGASSSANIVRSLATESMPRVDAIGSSLRPNLRVPVARPVAVSARQSETGTSIAPRVSFAHPPLLDEHNGSDRSITPPPGGVIPYHKRKSRTRISEEAEQSGYRRSSLSEADVSARLAIVSRIHPHSWCMSMQKHHRDSNSHA